jgi:hypothetical protein
MPKSNIDSVLSATKVMNFLLKEIDKSIIQDLEKKAYASHVEELCDTLIDLAKRDVRYTRSVATLMREISNHATCGKDASPKRIKKVNTNMSLGAKNLLRKIFLTESGSKSDLMNKWCSLTMCEHPKPLNVIWREIVYKAKKDPIDSVYVFKIFLKHPVVTITKEEDKRLAKVDPTSKMDAKVRYKKANIQIVRL